MEKKIGRPPGTGKLQYWTAQASSWQARATKAEAELAEVRENCNRRISTMVYEAHTARDEATQCKARALIFETAFVQTIHALAAVAK